MKVGEKRTRAYFDISEYVGKYNRVQRGHVSSTSLVGPEMAPCIRRGARIQRGVLYLPNGTLLYKPCTKNIKKYAQSVEYVLGVRRGLYISHGSST